MKGEMVVDPAILILEGSFLEHPEGARHKEIMRIVDARIFKMPIYIPPRF